MRDSGHLPEPRKNVGGGRPLVRTGDGLYPTVESSTKKLDDLVRFSVANKKTRSVFDHSAAVAAERGAVNSLREFTAGAPTRPPGAGRTHSPGAAPVP